MLLWSSARVHAGTVVTERPDVQQAIGAHMTGLIETEPIAEIQNGLEERGRLLLNPQATIDQVRGYEKAVAAGFQKIAVTVARTRTRARTNAHEARALRELGAKLGYRPFLLAVHTTGISEAEASALANNYYLVWSCASRAVREVVAERARLQMGISIPVFALTDEGKLLLLNRALYFVGSLVMHRTGLSLVPVGKPPEPMIYIA